MITFIDDQRAIHGVEPICKVLPIAPSTYHERVAQRRDPLRLSARARRDLALRVEVRRVLDAMRQWRWHLDEMYVKVNGEMRYLWRAVDHEGEILESFVTKVRDKEAALRFMKKALKRHGSPEAITTDGLRSYKAAMTELGNAGKQKVGRWANNRVENSHLSFRRRERAMLRFRRMACLQKFASVHANVHNHFNSQRHLVDRTTYKTLRSAALAEWQSLFS